MTDVTPILIAILCAVIVILFISEFKRPPNFPPGPRWLPVVGNSPFLKKLCSIHNGFHKALVYLSQEYETQILGLKLGGDLFVIVFSKDLIKQVFTKDEFQARPDSYFIRLRTMGSRKGITMTDGVFWQEQRNFAVRHLHNLGFGKSHMESLIIEELEDLISTLNGENNVATSIYKYLAPSVLNVLWALTAGKRFNSTDTQLTRLLELMAARSKAFDMAGGVLGQIPFISYFAPEWSGYNLICSLNKELKLLLEKTIEEHKKTLNMDNTRDFIDAFLQEIQLSSSSSTFTEEQLIMVCLDFFIAGSQTTSNTLSFALLHMALHQDIQEQVFVEIKEVLGERKLPALDEKIRLPFVEAVLLESQRFLHVVPVAGPRRVLRDTTLDKYKIPKNTTVLLSLYSIHHDEELWEQPMKFFPNRFMHKRNEKLMDEMYQFGLGKRRCLGEALAKNFIFLFFTGILRNFHLQLPPGVEPPTIDPIPGITLSPKPYCVKLTPR